MKNKGLPPRLPEKYEGIVKSAFDKISEKILSGCKAAVFIGKIKAPGAFSCIELEEQQVGHYAFQMLVTYSLRRHAERTNADLFVLASVSYRYVPTENGNPMRREDIVMFRVETKKERWIAECSLHDFMAGKITGLPELVEYSGPVNDQSPFVKIVCKTDQAGQDITSFMIDSLFGKENLQKISQSKKLKNIVIDIHHEIIDDLYMMPTSKYGSLYRDLVEELDNITGMDVTSKYSADGTFQMLSDPRTAADYFSFMQTRRPEYEACYGSTNCDQIHMVMAMTLQEYILSALQVETMDKTQLNDITRKATFELLGIVNDFIASRSSGVGPTYH